MKVNHLTLEKFEKFKNYIQRYAFLKCIKNTCIALQKNWFVEIYWKSFYNSCMLLEIELLINNIFLSIIEKVSKQLKW